MKKVCRRADHRTRLNRVDTVLQRRINDRPYFFCILSSRILSSIFLPPSPYALRPVPYPCTFLLSVYPIFFGEINPDPHELRVRVIHHTSRRHDKTAVLADHINEFAGVFFDTVRGADLQ